MIQRRVVEYGHGKGAFGSRLRIFEQTPSPLVKRLTSLPCSNRGVKAAKDLF
jgi:hypothetical protein